MKIRILPPLILAFGLLPLAVTAQEEGDEEEVEPTTQQTQATLEGVKADAPDAAQFGLSTAIDAVAQGGVDGQTVSTEARSQGDDSTNGTNDSGTSAAGSGSGGGEGGASGGGSGGGGSGGGGSGGRN